MTEGTIKIMDRIMEPKKKNEIFSIFYFIKLILVSAAVYEPGFSVRLPFHAKKILKNSTAEKAKRTRNSMERFELGYGRTAKHI